MSVNVYDVCMTLQMRAVNTNRIAAVFIIIVVFNIIRVFVFSRNPPPNCSVGLPQGHWKF